MDLPDNDTPPHRKTPATPREAVAAYERSLLARQQATLADERCILRLRASLVRYEASSEAVMQSAQRDDELRLAVESYATALKTANQTPEAVVIALNDVLSVVDVNRQAQAVLRTATVGWAMTAYFRVA